MINMNKTPEQQAIDFLEMVRFTNRISGQNGLPLIGSEYDAIKEAIHILKNMAYVTQQNKPKTD